MITGITSPLDGKNLAPLRDRHAPLSGHWTVISFQDEIPRSAGDQSNTKTSPSPCKPKRCQQQSTGNIETACLATALSITMLMGGSVAANLRHTISEVILRCVSKAMAFDKSVQLDSAEQQENQKSGVIPPREH